MSWNKVEKTLTSVLVLAMLVVCCVTSWLGAVLVVLVALALWRRIQKPDLGDGVVVPAVRAFKAAGGPNFLTVQAECEGRRWVVMVAPAEGDWYVQTAAMRRGLGWLHGEVRDDRHDEE